MNLIMEDNTYNYNKKDTPSFMPTRSLKEKDAYVITSLFGGNIKNHSFTELFVKGEGVKRYYNGIRVDKETWDILRTKALELL